MDFNNTYPQPPSSSSHSSEASSSLSPSKMMQQQQQPFDFSSSGNNDNKTNMLFAFLCEKIGDSAAHHIQEVFNAKCRRLEVENSQLKARNTTLEVENARLRNQIEIKDAIISNGSPKSATPKVSRGTDACHNNGGSDKSPKSVTPKVSDADTIANKSNGQHDGASTKSFEGELVKMKAEFQQFLQTSYAKQETMESKIVKAGMEIASLKKSMNELALDQQEICQNQKEILTEVDELHSAEEMTRDDIVVLMQRVTSLERDSPSPTSTKQQPSRRS